MEPRGDITKPSELDPVALGFMCGLEIHQQLDTGKLHSRMPSELFDYSIDEIPANWTRSSRRLRASQGESGQLMSLPDSSSEETALLYTFNHQMLDSSS